MILNIALPALNAKAIMRKKHPTAQVTISLKGITSVLIVGLWNMSNRLSVAK